MGEKKDLSESMMLSTVPGAKRRLVNHFYASRGGRREFRGAFAGDLYLPSKSAQL
jgi:hypothetical protein